MEIKRTNSAQMYFGSFKRDPVTMSKTLFDSIKDAPAVKAFGEKFEGTLSCDVFQSSRHKDRVQFALSVNDIKPINFKDKVRDFLNQNSVSSIQLKTHAVNEKDFIASVNRKDSETLFDIYNK